jgi:hypothetical protein
MFSALNIQIANALAFSPDERSQPTIFRLHGDLTAELRAFR